MKTLKRIVFVLVIVTISLSQLAKAQYATDKCEVSFFSDAPLEDITAKNAETKGVIDFTKKEFSFKVPIKSFKFEKGLMQEHFNENYLESEKYPYSFFKGVIEGDYDITKNGEYKVNANGQLTIHGVAQKRSLPVVIKVENGKISIQSKFKVKLEDYKIRVPTLVFQKIAEEVEVSISSSLRNLKP